MAVAAAATAHYNYYYSPTRSARIHQMDSDFARLLSLSLAANLGQFGFGLGSNIGDNCEPALNFALLAAARPGQLPL